MDNMTKNLEFHFKGFNEAAAPGPQHSCKRALLALASAVVCRRAGGESPAPSCMLAKGCRCVDRAHLKTAMNRAASGWDRPEYLSDVDVLNVLSGALRKLYMMGSVAALALGCAGGAGQPSADSDATPADPTEAPDPQRKKWPLGTTTYAPDAELLPATFAAFERIESVSGVQLDVAHGGVPMKLVDLPEDATWCARAMTTYNTKSEEYTGLLSIEVDRNLPAFGGDREGCGDGSPESMVYLLTHELVHHLAPGAGHTESPIGVMAPSYNDIPVFDDLSLGLMCSQAPCTKFTPEVYLADALGDE